MKGKERMERMCNFSYKNTRGETGHVTVSLFPINQRTCIFKFSYPLLDVYDINQYTIIMFKITGKITAIDNKQMHQLTL